MFTTLKRLYDLKLFDKQKMFESVKCNWITKKEYKEITGEDYPEQALEQPKNINVESNATNATINAE